MAHQFSSSRLKAYAEACLDANRYPDDAHRFDLFTCHTCGVVPFSLSIEHHTGSKARDFKGVIFGFCSKCGGRERVFSYTGTHRKHAHIENPVCQCGNDRFFAGQCERIEGDAGLLGFFDEGVVVGECSRCGRNLAFAYTD